MLKYNIIYADPPWQYKDKSLNMGGAERHYKTLPIEEIKNLPVKNLSHKNCLLFIWVTFPLLLDCISVFNPWGFKYKTCGFVWVKTKPSLNINQAAFFPVDSFDDYMGMGHYTRSNSEICLIGKKGTPEIINSSVKQIIYHPRLEHSRKPDETRDRIVRLCGDLPRIELFARTKTPGWDVWGNETDKFQPFD